MLIAEVALGRVFSTASQMLEAVKPPEGFDSVATVPRSESNGSFFEDAEFCVYDSRQTRLRYLLEFSLDGDPIPPERPPTPIELLGEESISSVAAAVDRNTEIPSAPEPQRPDASLVATVMSPGGRRRPEKISIPLKAVHIRAMVHDLVARVTLFQLFSNEREGSENIEAKYVFPLDENAAVCAFEAFINNKHVVGIHLKHIFA